MLRLQLVKFIGLWIVLLGVPCVAFEQVLEDFEPGVTMELNWGQLLPASQLIPSQRDPYAGKQCAELDYSFEPGQSVKNLETYVSHMIVHPANQLSLAVRGDNSGNIIRVRLQDRNGEWYQYDLGVVDYVGWQVFSVPATASAPAERARIIARAAKMHFATNVAPAMRTKASPAGDSP